MTNTSREATIKSQSDDDLSTRLLRQIQDIGVARFVGRINAGMIDATEGYRALEKFSSAEQRRPFISTLTHFLVGKHDPIVWSAETDR